MFFLFTKLQEFQYLLNTKEWGIQIRIWIWISSQSVPYLMRRRNQSTSFLSYSRWHAVPLCKILCGPSRDQLCDH